MNEEYKKLVAAFLKIGIDFTIGIDCMWLNKIKYKQVYSLINPWNYPKRIRGKVVAVAVITEFYDPAAMTKEIIESLTTNGVIIQEWDRRTPELRNQSTFLLNKEKMEFLPPEAIEVDLGEHK